MNKFYQTLFVLPLSGVAIALSTAPSLAGSFTRTGAIQYTSSPPKDLRESGTENSSYIWFFEEEQKYLLRSSRGLDVDIINPGTYSNNKRLSSGNISSVRYIDSYFLHANPLRTQRTKYNGSVTFDDEILGVIVRNGTLYDTDFLGLDNITYAARRSAGKNRGVMIGDVRADFVTLSSDRRTLNLDLTVGTAVDQIRVITEHSAAPTLSSFTLSSNTIDEGQSARAYFNATDPNKDTISFYLNGRNIGTDYDKYGTRSDSEYLGVFRDNGTYTYRGQARDEDGKYSNNRYQTLTVRNVAPTLTNFNIPTIDEGQSALAYLSGTDPGADALTFYLNGGDIGTDSRTSGIRSTTANLGLFLDEGTHTYSARIKDDDGAYSSTVSETFQVRNVAPTITNITKDLQIYPDMVFDFAADATDPGRLDVLTYNWDFDNDGIYDDFTGKSGKFSFSEPGDYAVKLQVADGDGGFDYDSFNVTVEPTEPFSFRFTDIKAVEGDPEGDKFQFAFEVVNWTDSPVAGIGIALNGKTETIKIDELPSLDGATVDLNGRPIGSDRDPIPDTPNRFNDGTVSSASKSAIEWKIKTPISKPNLTNLGDRTNVLDGFVFAVDDFDELEVMGLNWFLLDENGDPLGTAAGGNKYGFGMLDLWRFPFDDPRANFREGKLNGKPSEAFYNNVNVVEEYVPDTISASSPFGLVPSFVSSALRAPNFDDLLESEEEAIALFKGNARHGLTGRFLNPEDNKFNAPVNASVPEPSSILAMFGFAAASLLGLKRRR